MYVCKRKYMWVQYAMKRREERLHTRRGGNGLDVSYDMDIKLIGFQF